MRSFGHVFRRGNSWYIRVRRLGHPEWVRKISPVRHEDPAKDKGRKLAEQKLASIELDLAREKHLGIRVVGKVSLEAFLPVIRRLLASHAPTTQTTTLTRLQLAAKRLPGPMAEVTKLRAAEFLFWLRDERQCGPGTRNQYRSALSVAWRAAMERSLAIENPWLEVPRVKVERAPPPRLSAEDVAAIAARGPAWARVPILILSETGLRRGELVSLDWRDVDLGRRVLLVRRSKSGRSREVPLNSAAAALFAGLDRAPPPLQGPDPVFRELLAGSLTETFSRASKRCGFRGVHLHHLRASFITRALEGGAKVSTVRDLAGHSSIAVTNRYVSEASDEAKRRAVDTLARGSEGTARGTGTAAQS